MREELPPVDDMPKPAHGVVKGSYTERLQALRAGQAPVEVSKPRLFKRGKKAPKVAAEEAAAEPVVYIKQKRAPSDHPRPHKGVGRCPPCTCGCAMMKHAAPWVVAELKAGATKARLAATRRRLGIPPARPPSKPIQRGGTSMTLPSAMNSGL